MYDINIIQKKPLTVAILTDEKGRVFKGFAKLLPGDKWDCTTGRRIAVAKATIKALGKELKDLVESTKRSTTTSTTETKTRIVGNHTGHRQRNIKEQEPCGLEGVRVLSELEKMIAWVDKLSPIGYSKVSQQPVTSKRKDFDINDL